MKKLITGIALLASFSFFGQSSFIPYFGDLNIINYPSARLTLNGTGANNYAGGFISLKSYQINEENKHVSTLIGNYRDTDGIGTFELQRRNYSDDYKGSLVRYKDGQGWNFFVAENKTAPETTSVFRIDKDGNVGIGIDHPSQKLDVAGIARFHDADFNNATTNFLEIGHDGNDSFLNNKGSGSINFSIDNKNWMTLATEVIFTRDNGEEAEARTVLTVDGLIHSEEILLESNLTPDYVFEKYYNGTSTLKEDYTMPTLEEVEAYTKKHHHLPSIPSSTEIKEEGLPIKEMTNLLLQKIEELTLYTIEQEKRIIALEDKLNAQNK